MSKEKKNLNPEEELEAVEDDTLGDVAGGARLLPNIRVSRPDRDEPGIPGLPSGDSEDDGKRGKLGVKR